MSTAHHISRHLADGSGTHLATRILAAVSIQPDEDESITNAISQIVDDGGCRVEAIAAAEVLAILSVGYARVLSKGDIARAMANLHSDLASAAEILEED